MLTATQIDHYHEHGFVTPDFQLPESTIAEIRDAHNRLIQRHPEFSDYCSALLAYDTWYLRILAHPPAGNLHSLDRD